MPINPKFSIKPKPASGKIDDITKQFKITQSVKTVGTDKASKGGSGSGSGKNWKKRHYS